MPDVIEIRPQPKQEIFLSTPADIAIYGGSAGGGKTWAILAEPLRHTNNGSFGAVVFRRTIPEITREGGMWDEAIDIYPALGASPNQNSRTFTFHSGASIAFAHLQLERSKYAWRGAQIPLIEFDQLETFTESQWWYLFSRNRSKCGVSPYIRATANPEPGWLADLLAWWIDEDGWAIPERSGVIRWIARVEDKVIWGDTRDDIEKQSPGAIPKSFTFILSTLDDNQVLLNADPGYRANLMMLPYVERMRLLGDGTHQGGNWKIKPSAGKVFKREWFEIVPALPMAKDYRVACRYFDFAGTAKKALSDDPDYSAGIVFEYIDGIYYVVDFFNQQISASSLDRISDQIYKQDKQKYDALRVRYMARWENEPGSASLRDSAARTRRLSGIDARGISKREDKLSSWMPLASQAEIGNVKVLKASWNEEWLNAMYGVPDLPHDDIPDASAGAYNEIVRDIATPKATSRQG